MQNYEQEPQPETRHHRHHYHRHHRRHWLRWLWITIAGLLVIAAIFAGMAWRNVRNATTNMLSADGGDNRSITKTLKAKKPVSILLLGTDTGELGRTEKGRTDTMLIATINTKTNQTTLVSLPRDQKVNLPGYEEYSPSKINAAYTYGGVKEAMKVVEQQYNVPLDGYLLVNMGGMEKAIDQIGGVDVTSPITFKYEGYSFKKGKTYHMDGKKALAFSRMRYDDPEGDYGRQNRQRLIIGAVIKESASYKAILNQKFLHSISSEMKTNLTFGNMTQLAWNYRDATQIISEYAQGVGEMSDGVSYQIVNYNERQRISNILRKSLELPAEDLPTTTSSDSND